MTREQRRAIEARGAGKASRALLCMVVVLAASISVASVPTEAGQWAEALGEARSVIKVLAYALVATSAALAAVVAFLVRLLSGQMNANTAAMAECHRLNALRGGRSAEGG